MSDLPKWKGASKVYSNAYRALEKMSKSHVRISGLKIGPTCYPSQEMDDLIEALNDGNEERIKGLMLLYRTYNYF